MSVGAYNKIVALQHITGFTKDDHGGQVPTWATYATVWARVAPLKGRELIAAQAAQSETTTRFEMHYRADVDQKDRILYGGKYYNIMAVIDPEEAHRELQIMAGTGLNEG